MSTNNTVIDFINTNRDNYVEQLKEYLAIPSISALPQHAADVRRCAEWTAEEMRRIGLNGVRIIETPGHPVVFGEWLGAEGAPTILFYGHYDVQPVDPVDLWESPPFEATVTMRSPSRRYSSGRVNSLPLLRPVVVSSITGAPPRKVPPRRPLVAR